MTTAQTIHEYTTFLQQSQKEFESKGVSTNFRRLGEDGAIYFMTITNSVKIDRIVRNEVESSRYPKLHEVVDLWASGGWERV